MRSSRNIFLCAALTIFLSVDVAAQVLPGPTGIRHPRQYPITNDKPIWAPPTKADTDSINTLIILGAFSDVAFMYPKTQFEQVLKEQEFSAEAYLSEQLGYNVNIDIFGPFTVDKKRSYYGTNDAATGNDLHPGEFIADVCKKADEEIDFSKYDFNNDGYVDNVFVIYSGGDEANQSESHPEYIWAHSWSLKDSDFKKKLELDSISVNRYACSAELAATVDAQGLSTETIAQIGSFCHEFMHPLGLVDFYDTDYEKSGGTAGALWLHTDIMDAGNYNNYSKTPPYLNCVDRELLGLMVPEELKTGSYTIYPIGQSEARSYKITNPSDNDDYFLLECRGNDRWDKYIGGKGLLLYHIDKSEKHSTYSDKQSVDVTSAIRWYPINEVNCRPDHQCADLIEADGRVDVDPTSMSYQDISGVFFPQPGSYNIGGTANVKLRFWDGTFAKTIIKDITLKSDGSVTFDVQTTDSPLPPAPTDPPKDTDMLYIIIQKAEGVCSLSVNNSVGATVKWYFDGAPISDPDAFVMPSSGELHAAIYWSDGTEDHLFKTVRQ